MKWCKWVCTFEVIFPWRHGNRLTFVQCLFLFRLLIPQNCPFSLLVGSIWKLISHSVGGEFIISWCWVGLQLLRSGGIACVWTAGKCTDNAGVAYDPLRWSAQTVEPMNGLQRYWLFLLRPVLSSRVRLGAGGDFLGSGWASRAPDHWQKKVLHTVHQPLSAMKACAGCRSRWLKESRWTGRSRDGHAKIFTWYFGVTGCIRRCQFVLRAASIHTDGWRSFWMALSVSSLLGAVKTSSADGWWNIQHSRRRI